jgi:triacylglycerol lipase
MKPIFCFLSAFPVILLSSCGTTAPDSIGNRIAEITSAPKYPIILVHGIASHDRGGFINFWGRIPDALKINGAKVFFGNTDSWGGYESNAEILKATIDRVLEETNSEKVNIIAHSKGGIDSRYLIWNYNYGNKVASLTTISTPHHGSEIADLIYQQKIVHTGIARRTLVVFSKIFGDTNPDPFSVNYQLTTEHMKEFNEKIGMDNNVYYQSLYTTMNNPFDDLMFSSSYWYIKDIRGANDGVVSEWSTKWGDNIIKIEGGISHAEIIDYKKKNISGINIPDIFLNIVNSLSKMGF